MAYNRAPRWSAVYSSTGPNVAPNSYQTIYDDQCSCRGTNWAPFLSCSKRRDSVLDTGIPAPNAYYPQVEKSTIGGNSLRYTAPRRAKEIPKRPFRPRPHRVQPPRLKGFMYHCQVPYTLLGYPPTIPNIGHMGYKSLEDKTLVECCDPNYDITLGPAFYEVGFEHFCDVYKGPYWSRYSGRKPHMKSDIPGVGTYNIEPQPNSLDDYLNKLRQERKKYSFSLRYADQLQMREIRNNFPAPNQYVTEKVKCWRAKKVVHVPKKLIRTKKIPRKDDTGPAPNQYNDPRTAFYSLIKPSCKKGLSAFLTKAPRFGKKSLEKTGPSFYMLPSFVDEMAKKVSPYAVRDTAFDSSIPKKPISLKEQIKAVQVPKEIPPEPAPPPKPPRSITQRFLSLAPTYQASPGSYNIRESYALTVMPRSFRKVAKYEFLSTERRFAPVRDFFAVEDKSYIPGCIYNLKKISPCRRINPGSFSLANRFPPGPKDITPGPDTYNIRLRKTRTFNVTLKDTASLTPPQVQQMKLLGTYPHHNHVHHKDHPKKMRKNRDESEHPSVKVVSVEQVTKCKPPSKEE